MEYLISIRNDMIKEYRIKAENVSDALLIAKDRIRESDVTAIDSNGEYRKKPMSEYPKVIRIAPDKPVNDVIKPPTKEEKWELLLKNCPE